MEIAPFSFHFDLTLEEALLYFDLIGFFDMLFMQIIVNPLHFFGRLSVLCPVFCYNGYYLFMKQVDMIHFLQRQAFEGLGKSRPFLFRFFRTIDVLFSVMKLLLNHIGQLLNNPHSSHRHSVYEAVEGTCVGSSLIFGAS